MGPWRLRNWPLGIACKAAAATSGQGPRGGETDHRGPISTRQQADVELADGGAWGQETDGIINVGP